MSAKVAELSPKVYDMIRILYYEILIRMSDLGSNSLLIRMRDKWPEMERLGFPRDGLRLMVVTIPEFIVAALKIVGLRPPLLESAKTYKDEKFVKRPYSQLSPTDFYKIGRCRSL